MATELQTVQRIVGQVLIPEARRAQKNLPSMEDSLPIALELTYASFAMKPAHRTAALYIARAYAERMGLDWADVEGFAIHRLNQVAAGDSTPTEGA